MRYILAAATIGLCLAGAAFAQYKPGAAPQPQAAQGDYPDLWRRNFVEGCVGNPPEVPREVCECGIRHIAAEVPFADSVALDQAAAAGREPNPVTVAQYRAIMQRCVANPRY